MRMSAKDVQDLREATKRAVGAGQCQYVIDDQPGCVIGQLLHIRGIDVETLDVLDNLVASRTHNPSAAVSEFFKCGVPEEVWDALGDISTTLLIELQAAWDDSNPHDADDARRHMLDVIEKWR